MQYGVGELAVTIERLTLEPLRMATGTWTRHSTAVRLHGRGEIGSGEDITYEEGDQRTFQAHGSELSLTGTFTLDEFSAHLDRMPLFTVPPSRSDNALYRRWAFESAALDLALRQAGSSLGRQVGRKPEPVRYVVSMSLGDPPDVGRLRRVRSLYPGVDFKVDLSESWTIATVRELGELGGIATIDLKGHYFGSFTGPRPDPDLYRMVAEGLPAAWLEDPWWDGPAWMTLADHRHRVTWDAVIHSVADIVRLPIVPPRINIKPSRFGFLSELLRTYEYCTGHGIAMYGGGQFELGPGRAQIQYLASLFHADDCNDVAPSGFNAAEFGADLPASPMSAPCAFGVG